MILQLREMDWRKRFLSSLCDRWILKNTQINEEEESPPKNNNRFWNWFKNEENEEEEKSNNRFKRKNKEQVEEKRNSPVNRFRHNFSKDNENEMMIKKF